MFSRRSSTNSIWSGSTPSRRPIPSSSEAWLTKVTDERGIALPKAPNVTCKISGVAMTDPRFTAQSLARWIDACLDTFGPDHCIIGSNWPVDRLYSSYDPIMNIYRDHVSRFDEADQRKILSENAQRLYRVL